MANSPTRGGQTFHLFGVEHRFKEVDQPRCAIHDQIRRDGVKALGLRLDRHGLTPLVSSDAANLGWDWAWRKRYDREGRRRCPCSVTTWALPNTVWQKE